MGPGVTTPTRRATSAKKKRGRWAAVLIAVVLIVAAGVIAILLTTGGATVVEEGAAVASAPQKGYDQAAQSLLRNAMTAMDSAFVESADYTAVTQSTLDAMEPAITWMHGGVGACAAPSSAAQAQKNSVTWVCTGRLTYEIGTWSASGVEFGVKVNRAGGGITYYKNGEATTW
jgi:hypothetical protein